MCQCGEAVDFMRGLNSLPCCPAGQWHEPSTRYHGRVLAAFIPFAYALRHAGIIDAFNEIPEFKRFVGYYRLVQTPPDRLMGGCALTPALSGE